MHFIESKEFKHKKKQKWGGEEDPLGIQKSSLVVDKESKKKTCKSFSKSRFVESSPCFKFMYFRTFIHPLLLLAETPVG
jgi:hypothetical protein